MDRYIISRLRGVANKVAYCVGCKSCMVECPVGAFEIMENGKILIRERDCIHCGNCISFSAKGGCLVAKSLSTTGGTEHGFKRDEPLSNFWLSQRMVGTLLRVWR